MNKINTTSPQIYPHNSHTLFIDADDVILNTSETILKLLHTPKSLQDLHDWGFRSITPDFDEQLFSSQQFHSQLRVRPDFYNLLASHTLNPYTLIITSHSTPQTAIHKRDLIDSVFSLFPVSYDFLFIPHSTPKSTIDMSSSIQIDDNINNLIPTNASIKILLTNNLETDYNAQLNLTQITNTDIYSVPTLQDLGTVLQFFAKER